MPKPSPAIWTPNGMMKRRDFPARLGGIALSAFVLSQITIERSPEHQIGALAIGSDGRRYRYYRADRRLYEGHLCEREDGTILGVAISPMEKGQYGWIQTCGATRIMVD